MPDLILAIDGGGSQTRAAIALADETVVESALVNQGSNPWKGGGFESASRALIACLNQFTKLSEVTTCVAGISGCHSDNKFSLRFKDLLSTRLPNARTIRVVGDLVTSFRAASPTAHGQLAIAGSGSAIAHFYPQGTNYVYDAIGYGGRDIAAAIVASAQRGEQTSEAVAWLEEKLNRNINDLAQLGDVYHYKPLLTIGNDISNLDDVDPILQSFLPLIHHCAWRWAYKLWGTTARYRTSADLPTSTEVYTVLSGGAWKLDPLRSEVTRLLAQSDAQLKLVYNPQVTPLSGAVALAVDLL